MVDVLKALDDRIALMPETNATRESIAQALFKSWFVDFDPVRAKQQGRAPLGMDKATAALFPDRFEESARGPIPKGWRTGPILDLASLLGGGTPKTDRPEFWGGDIAWASAKDVSQSSSSVLITTERTITSDGLDRSSTRMIPRLATVVVARGATTGRLVLLGREMAMNQTCYALTSKCDAPIALYCQLRREIDALVTAAHGSVFDTITTSTFGRSNVIQPPQDILARFEEVGRPIFDRIVEATARSQTLASLRDTLLPRLISGQLCLPEAEAALSA
jgi:type I restriction enzyme S subunit